MTRQKRIFTAPLVATLLGLLCIASSAHASRNVLFIVIDDLRLEAQAITPNLDTFAAQSTRYTNAYTPVPSCVGARTTILTGLKPSTHGVGLTVFDLSGYDELFSDPNTTTLQEVMADNGYYTATTGKVSHFQHPEKWDEAEPYVTAFELFNFFAPGPDGTHMMAAVLQEGESHPDETTADWAINFIDSYAETDPFFLAIGFFQPHIPWIAPQWAWDLYPSPTTYGPISGDFADEPIAAKNLADELLWNNVPNYDLIQNAGQTERYTRAYLAATSYMDQQLGRVLEALANSPYAANTDIVIWSDNGYHLGEKRHWRKMTFWEPSVRVPFFIKSPALAVGDVNEEVTLLDIAPTVLNMLGLPVEPQFEGVSLVATSSPVEIYYGDGMATVDNGTKNIDYDVNVTSDSDLASYFLTNDPTEATNLTPPPGC